MFSYIDIKKLEISDNLIKAFAYSSIIIFLITKFSINSIYVILFCLIWFGISLLLWKYDSIGGADVKILSFLPIYLSNNIFIEQTKFFILFGIIGVIYGLLAKKIIKNKKEIPFIPIIALCYLIVFFLN